MMLCISSVQPPLYHYLLLVTVLLIIVKENGSDNESPSSPELTPTSVFYDPDAQVPLGSHRPASVLLDELGIVPDPTEFSRRYVSKYQPVVFRGAAKESGAFLLWTEEYLVRKYGDLTVRLESRHEDSTRIPAGVGGLGRDTIANFLQHYQSADSYVITQLPRPMERDVSVPPCLTCGSFSRTIQEVNLFLSARGGRTLLHRDPLSSVHCVFNGTKQWIVIDPKQKDSLYMADDSMYEFGGYSTIDVNNVDYEEFPKVRDVEYARVVLSRGDCIYMPSGYMHQVRSSGYLNSAVSIWFSHYYDFDDAGCDVAPAGYRPLAELDVLWRYSGHGNMSLGSGDVFMLRTVLLTLADVDGQIWIEPFLTNFITGEPEQMDYYISVQNALRRLMDPTGRGFVTREEVNDYSIEKLKEFCLVFSRSDPSDTDVYEYTLIKPGDIKRLYRRLLKQSKDGTFPRTDFVERYMQSLGGTSIYANKILDHFGKGVDMITAEMVDRFGDVSVGGFVESPRDHDPTTERIWYRHLVRQGIMRKFRVVHDEL